MPFHLLDVRDRGSLGIGFPRLLLEGWNKIETSRAREGN